MHAPKKFRPWLTIAVVLTVWGLLAFAWSYYVIEKANADFTNDTLYHTAARMGSLYQGEAAADRARAQLLNFVRLEDTIAYAMVWAEDGQVLAHTAERLTGSYLDVQKWPALEKGQRDRVRRFATEVYPQGGRQEGDAPRTMSVIEVTLELNHPTPAPASGPDGVATRPRAQRVFLSVAADSGALEYLHMSSRMRLHERVLAFVVGGGMLLSGILLIVFRRGERSRREIEQNARARTSLLTERGMLASVLAHEVRSPLTALRFNLHALRALLAPPAENAGDDPDKRLELTDRCEREIRRLDGMLNDFLQRTQIVTPGETADLNAVIGEAVEFLRPALDRQHIRIALHLDATNPRVHVHPDELRQVILNLAANAMDAMPAPKGGTLAISTVAPGATATAETHEAAAALPATMVPAEGLITVLFRDSGIGIPADRLERVFEPFFSTKPNGSGLGLTLVRRVVSGAGGTVLVESKVADPATPASGGTTFRILLPASNG
jgi:signal transduction histidine kinase